MNQTRNTVLDDLATLDPAVGKRSTDRETVDETRRWVLGHDRHGNAGSSQQPAGPGVAGLTTRLDREPAQAGARRTGPMRRRVVLVAAGIVLISGIVGVLPNLSPNGGTTPSAAAIPLLEYSQPNGVDGAGALEELAGQLLAAGATDEAGRFFFEHRQHVGYSMHEVEVSEGQWVVDSLEFHQDDSYYWIDITDLSGGQLYLSDGEAHEAVHPAGQAQPSITVPDSAQALYDLLLADPEQRASAGDYLIREYNAQANQLTVAERVVFLEAIALAGDVTSYGEVTDREGRAGVAFGASRLEDVEGENLEIESIIILDRTTGEVLEVDTIYPNALPGAPDVVEEYDLVVDSRYADTVPLCGSQSCPGVSNH